MIRIVSSVATAIGICACGPSTSDDGPFTSAGSGTDGGATSSGDSISGPGTSSTASTSVGSTSGADGSSTETGVPEACAAVGWDTSFAVYQELAAQAAGRYWYSSKRYVYDGFAPACSYTTTVEIADDVAIRRVLAEPEPEEDGDVSFCTDPAFDEMGAEVGTHDLFVAGPPWTAEQLYESCCEDVLSLEPADEYDIYFDTFDNGLLRLCGAYPLGCADGCGLVPDGFGSSSLEQFELGPLPG